MNRVHKYVTGVALASALLIGTPATAATIVLNNTGGVDKGTQVYKAFNAAAAFWGAQFSNNVTVNLDVGFRSLGPSGSNILGQTFSNQNIYSISDYAHALTQTATSSVGIQAAAHLPTIGSAGNISVITPGFQDPLTGLGINARTRMLDSTPNAENSFVGVNTADAKAVGLGGLTPGTADGGITFNSDFNFDLDPTNGTSSGQINFLVVAIHEIGHALGFVSGVDDFDYFAGPNGPGAAVGLTFNQQDYQWGSALDLFRYSSNPEGLGNSAGPALDWSIRNGPTDGTNFAQPYFSIDGGQTAFLGNLLSRGQFNTNSYQASHWRSDTIRGQRYLGIMDPVGSNDNYVTALDLGAFCSIGWNCNLDVLANPTWSQSTASIFSQYAVPEPSTWLSMLIGFFCVGGALRTSRRTKKAVFGAASA